VQCTKSESAVHGRAGGGIKLTVSILRHAGRIALDAFWLFLADDGWAIASHIALSALMALFPFLIVLTALAGFIGSKELADQAALILLEAWPAEVAGPISGEIHRVLTTARGDVLTVGVGLALYFSSSGVESLRIGLNRAYDVKEARGWWLLRLESIGCVLVGGLALLALAFLVVLWPFVFATAVRYAHWLQPLEGVVTFARLAAASLVLVMALVLVHLWLPAGRRRFVDIAPGVIATLALWLTGGLLFARYLDGFSGAYVRTYAGLASVMIALVFLYLSASIFIYGGELNAAIRRARVANSE
jgi:membrane protein